MASYAATPPTDHTAPRTPTSLPSLSTTTIAATGTDESPNLLHPPFSRKADLTTANISPKSGKAGFSPRSSPLPLTGAAAMAELKRLKQQQQRQQNRPPGGSRQTSPNPAIEAVQSLMGVSGMSRPTDAPAPDKMSEPLQRVAERISVSDGGMSTDHEQVSPTSLGSFGTLEGTSPGHSMTATASEPASGQHFVAEPAEMAAGAGYHENNGNLAVMEQDGNKAFSYPGPPQSEQQSQDGGPSRGMSLPGYGQSSPASPASNNKRHKCPYCSTDFTRHHNLKSHLLTHSQEKPYVCQTCQARFRRLHDLKRHTKLHTGERPHTCDKCGRRFARGDALARHNKGPGGCAGRRSSFGGDDDYGPDGGDMDGVEYGGADDDEDSTDAQGRRVSEPSRKRQQLETPHDSNREVYRQHSSTYPPAQHQRMRGSVGDMGPPTVVHPGSSNAASPREMSGHPSPAGGAMGSYYPGSQVFAEPGMMTQSPKPLSPGQVPDQHRLSVADAAAQSQLGRNRSTSLTTQFQQAHFGRGSTDGRTPPLPNTQLNPHILPPLGAGGQGQMRPSMQPNSFPTGPAGNMMHSNLSNSIQGGGQGSNQGSLSSHGRSSGSSMRDVAGNEQADIWAYVRSLEQRFSRMQDEYELRISRQHEEIISLKQQMSQLTGSYSSDMGGGSRGPPPYPNA